MGMARTASIIAVVILAILALIVVAWQPSPPDTSDGTDIRTRTVKLFFYDPKKDTDASGNILCSRQGLVATERQIPLTTSPVQDTVRLLLLGPTADEKASGITSEFPLPGVELTGATSTDGTLTLTFADPESKTVGGSCRIGVLWAQIEATAKQFPGISEVRFSPSELFQP